MFEFKENHKMTNKFWNRLTNRSWFLLVWIIVILTWALASRGAGTYVNRPYSALVNGVMSRYQRNWPNTRRALGTNGVVLWVRMGDSLMTGINGIGVYFDDTWTNNIGYAGTISGPGQSMQLISVAGGASVITGDFTTWYSSYVSIPNGGSATFAPASGNGFVADTVFVATVGQNGGGTINVQTNTCGGAYATWASINSNNGGVKHGDVLWLTNAVGPVQTTVKLVGTAGTTVVPLLGILNFKTNGWIICDQAIDGQDLGQFMSVGTNIWAPIYGALHAQAFVYKATDNAAIIQNNFPTLLTVMTNYCTNSDFCAIGIEPLELPSDDSVALTQNLLIFNFTQNAGLGFFDGRAMFYDYPTGLRDGYLRTPGDPHLTTAGNIYQWDQFIGWTGLFNGSRFWFNSAESKTMTWRKSFDYYSQLVLRGAGNAGAGIYFIGTNGANYNFGLYADTSQNTHRMVFRNSGSGANETFVMGNNGSGTEEFAPSPSVVAGVPVNIGRKGGKTFDVISSTNLDAQNYISLGGGLAIPSTFIYVTNNVPNYNVQNGSLCLRTDVGTLYLRTNNTWIIK